MCYELVIFLQNQGVSKAQGGWVQNARFSLSHVTRHQESGRWDAWGRLGFPAKAKNARWCGKTCVSITVILSLRKARLAQLKSHSCCQATWQELAGIRGAEGSWCLLPPTPRPPTPSTNIAPGTLGLWQWLPREVQCLGYCLGQVSHSEILSCPQGLGEQLGLGPTWSQGSRHARRWPWCRGTSNPLWRKCRVHRSPVEGTRMEPQREGGFRTLCPPCSSLIPSGPCACVPGTLPLLARLGNVFRVFWKIGPWGRISEAHTCPWQMFINLSSTRHSERFSSWFSSEFRAHRIFLLKEEKVMSVISKYSWLHSLWLILTQSLWDTRHRYHQTHFVDGKTEASTDPVTHSRSHIGSSRGRDPPLTTWAQEQASVPAVSLKCQLSWPCGVHAPQRHKRICRRQLVRCRMGTLLLATAV